MLIKQEGKQDTFIPKGLHPPLVYIFKTRGLLRDADREEIKNDLRQQFAEGLVVFDSRLEFIGCFGEGEVTEL